MAVSGQAGIGRRRHGSASLLPVVERVALERLDEFGWRAVSLRWFPRTVRSLTMQIPDSSRFDAMKQEAGLALFLARYDRELARSVLGPVIDQLLALPAEGDLRIPPRMPATHPEGPQPRS